MGESRGSWLWYTSGGEVLMKDFTDGRDGSVGREGRANTPIAPFERVKLPLSKPSNLGFSNLGFSGVNRGSTSMVGARYAAPERDSS